MKSAGKKEIEFAEWRCAPFGHKTHLRVLIVPDLLKYDELLNGFGL